MGKEKKGMNSIEVWHMLNIIFLIFGALFIVAAIFEFFAFNILKIFQDLTGITKKRALKAMSENTEYTGQLRHKSNFKKNEKIVSPSGKLKQSGSSTTGRLSGARKKAIITPPPEPDNSAIYTPKASKAAVVEEEATDVLDTNTVRQTDSSLDEAATEVLQAAENVEKQPSENETTVLNAKKIKTNKNKASTSEEKAAGPHKEIHFLLERQILMTHTNEVIE